MTRRPLAALVLSIALAGCGGDDGEGAATTTTLAPGGLPAGIEELPATDTAVETVKATFEAGLGSTAPGSVVDAVVVAYRGPHRAFSDAGCPSVPRTDEVVVVVYFEGTFTSPSGEPSRAALVSQAAGSPNATGTLFVDEATRDPLAWCRPPG